MKRIFGLDLIRTVAIIFVLLCHSVYIIYPLIPELLGNTLLHYGVYGVDLFFVLSGFLIGRIFLKDLILNNSIDFKQFWIRRWFRTLPNYYLFLIIHIILMLLSFKDEQYNYTGYVVKSIPFSHLLKYPFFLQNIVEKYSDFFAQSWSLSVEEWFYIFLPFLFFYFLKIFRTTQLKKIIPFLFVFVILLLVWKCYVFLRYNDFYSPGMVIFNFDQIIFGVFLAAVYLHARDRILANRRIILVFGLLLYIVSNYILVRYILVNEPVLIAEMIMHVCFLGSFGLLILYFADFYSSDNSFTAFIQIVSKSSYSIYLSHMLILFLLVDKILLRIPFLLNLPAGRFIIFGIYIVFTIYFSYFIYLKFELPMLNLRNRYKVKNVQATELSD